MEGEIAVGHVALLATNDRADDAVFRELHFPERSFENTRAVRHLELDDFSFTTRDEVEAQDLAPVDHAEDGARGNETGREADIDASGAEYVQELRTLVEAHHDARACLVGEVGADHVAFVVLGGGDEVVGVGSARLLQDPRVGRITMQDQRLGNFSGERERFLRLSLDHRDVHVVLDELFREPATDVSSAGDDDFTNGRRLDSDRLEKLAHRLRPPHGIHPPTRLQLGVTFGDGELAAPLDAHENPAVGPR